jgi:5-methylcytosine-specific restriction protein A
MPNIVGRTGTELNSTYQINDFQGVAGLILESWGPSSRNADYNEALEVILERLQILGLSEIGVNVISRELVDLLPSFPQRALIFDAPAAVSLRGREPRDIRLEIGRAQARLKADPGMRGGNRTKRILLHSTHLTSKDWSRLASPSRVPSPVGPEHFDSIMPEGSQTPRTFTQMTVLIERDSSVRTWVLRSATGTCELCKRPAPFFDSDGVPFLEVHHVVPLASGGPDTISNAVALCPNCHRELHHGAARLSKLEQLYSDIPRLIRTGGQHEPEPEFEQDRGRTSASLRGSV